jgi:hyperosmotically inducible protein
MKSAAWIVVPVVAVLTLALSAGATPASQTVAEKTKEGAVKTKDAVVKGAKVAAEKTKEGLSKTGEVMTDAWITSRVHARFVNEDLLKDSDISVDTDKHVVTLKGTVMGRAGRAKATSVAKGTEGVHRVVNRLTIGPKR